MLHTKFRVSWPFGSGEKQILESTGLSVQEKNRSQDGSHGGYLRFPIRMNLTIFHLLVTIKLPTKFQDNKPFISGEEVKSRFSRCRSWLPSWISHRNNLSYFFI